MLFIYNLILTVFFTIAFTGFYVIYMKNKKRSFLFLALLHLLLIIDNSIIYISEFSNSFELLYETTNILYIVIYLVYFAIILTGRLIVSELFNDRFTIIEKQISIILPVILLIINIFGSYEIGEFVIYLSFFVMLSYITFRAYKNINNSSYELNEIKLKKYKIFTLIIMILSIIAIIECGIFYISDSTTTNPNNFTLDYRNIPFDIIKLFICIIGMKNLYSSFNNLFDKKSIDDKLNGFCIKYSLTNRQKEIIELIIAGHSNKEISSKLNITEGTVKTHIYNIFKKTDVSNRNQIIKRIMDI